MSVPVTSVEELVRKYGTRTIPMAVEKFILSAPSFDGDDELAILLGEMMADLEFALRSVRT